MAEIDQEYQRRIDALSVKERIAKSMEMLSWTRQTLARQIRKENGSISDERLKLEVALRLYAADDKACALIRQRLVDVPS